MFKSSGKLPSTADLVIIGGGCTALSVAYNLTKKNFNKIVILEKSYLTSGSTGRNGGGIREQFNSVPTITLMKRAIDQFQILHREIGFNYYFRQDGYLFLAFSEKQMDYLKTTVKLQNQLGVKSLLLTSGEIKTKFPRIKTDSLLGGAFNQRDGTAVPFAYCWGLLQKIIPAGVEVFPFIEATGIDLKGGEVHGVETTRGFIKTNRVLNATNAWSKEINRFLDLPDFVTPERHQILASEPLKPFLDPMVVSLDSGIYFSQTSRGEIVGGISCKLEPQAFNYESSFYFVKKMSTHLIKLLPGLKEVAIMRQWGGVYGVTPDHCPIFEKNLIIPGYFQAVGFSGHGFMMAPVTGEIMADLILEGESRMDISSFQAKRFLDKSYHSEQSILG